MKQSGQAFRPRTARCFGRPQPTTGTANTAIAAQYQRTAQNAPAAERQPPQETGYAGDEEEPADAGLGEVANAREQSCGDQEPFVAQAPEHGPQGETKVMTTRFSEYPNHVPNKIPVHSRLTARRDQERRVSSEQVPRCPPRDEYGGPRQKQQRQATGPGGVAKQIDEQRPRRTPLQARSGGSGPGARALPPQATMVYGSSRYSPLPCTRDDAQRVIGAAVARLEGHRRKAQQRQTCAEAGRRPARRMPSIWSGRVSAIPRVASLRVCRLPVTPAARPGR